MEMGLMDLLALISLISCSIFEYENVNEEGIGKHREEMTPKKKKKN